MKWRFALLILSLLVAGCTDGTVTGVDEPQSAEPSTHVFRHDGGSGTVTVLTRNIYVGADVDILLAAQDPEQIPVLAAEAFQMLLATNFPERAQALADEIAAAQPQLVGLQEVSLIRRQSPGDAILGGTTPAEDVVFDYLEILLEALAARGLDYRVAGMVQNPDAEFPMLVNVDPPMFDDARLTDFDVVLARSDVEVSRVAEVNYQARLPIPTLGIEIPRGYVAVDARVGERTYRFVNTHLEPALLAIQLAQAVELVAALENETLPVILLGDLNTAAPTGETYRLLRAVGYVDAWTRNLLVSEGSGFTCCHDADLRNEEVKLDRRIDLVMVRNVGGFLRGRRIGPVFAFVVGDELDDRTPSGLWPSDHAGVVAQLKIPVLPRLLAGGP